jgi:dTDP-4-amino-4,6-dideoxygalactose transaminase
MPTEAYHSVPASPEIPLLRPNPPRFADLRDALAVLDASGVFTNNGRLVRQFEAAATETLFGGIGGCVTVCNATMGLILAISHAAGAGGKGGLALMPSFTFAATAHAALWAGLTPLLCDIDPDTWIPSAESEEKLLRQHSGRVSVIVPYATFGNGLDLERYAWLSRRHDVGVVVDAASSLGSTHEGRGFGAGSRLSFVFSMHATKTFATAEGGLIYSADDSVVRTMRQMANFGFGAPRSATMPGLNAKMSEIAALLAMAKLREIDSVVAHRTDLARLYRQELHDFGLQRSLLDSQALQFMPVLLPPGFATQRRTILARLAASGIGAGAYFSPHLAQQPYFEKTCLAGKLPVTADIAGRILALPMADTMTPAEVYTVCAALRAACFPREAALSWQPPAATASAIHAHTPA